MIRLVIAPHAKPQPAQRIHPGGFPGLEKQAAVKRFIALIGLVGGRARIVWRAVEHPRRIAHPAVQQIPVQLHAQVPVGHQIRHQTPFVEQGIRIPLQLLQAHRRLELARLHLQFRTVMVIQVRVLDLHKAAREIRREVIIKIMEHRAGENRPRPAQQKTAVPIDPPVTEKRAAVPLDHRMQLRHKVGIARGETEPVLPQADLGGRLRRVRRRVLVDFPVPFQNPDLLVQLLKLLLQQRDFRATVVRQHPARALHRQNSRHDPFPVACVQFHVRFRFYGQCFLVAGGGHRYDRRQWFPTALVVDNFIYD